MKLSRVILLCVICVSGCQFDPGGDSYTRKEPIPSSLVGAYVPTAATLTFIRTKGHYPTTQSTIELHKDGSFVLTNVPDWWQNRFGTPGGGFDSGLGQWSVVNLQGAWQIELTFDSTKDFSSSHNSPRGLVTYISLIGEASPYTLHLTVGDPDMGDAMQYTRTRGSNAG